MEKDVENSEKTIEKRLEEKNRILAEVERSKAVVQEKLIHGIIESIGKSRKGGDVI